MNLILLYGPPAVGKLTVARELQKLTGYKLFDNHSVIDVVNEIFGWENPARSKLEYEIRGRVVDEAARSKVNLIVTGGILNHNRFLYSNMVESYKKENGNVYLVQMIADKKVLIERVQNEDRKKKINDMKFLAEYLDEYTESFDKFGEGEQLIVDTSKTQPKEAAAKVIDYYKLK